MPENINSQIVPPGALEGERIVVRPYVDDDAPAMFEAIQESIEHLRPWMPWADTYHTVEDSVEYIRQCQVRFQLRTDFPMGTFLRSDGTYLGGTGLHVGDAGVPSFEIGYWIRSSAQGHGYVTEAARLLTMHAFDAMGAQRMMIQCEARNERSKRIPERLGYAFEGRERNVRRDTSGNLTDALIYAMIPEDYRRAREEWSRNS
ncbi:MAG TPA: GNAT family protein [Chloroflexota bacterium]